MEAPAILVEDLTKRFGGFVAVDRVSFDVRTGEVFGFLGPNGAGKTTTIKMLNGLVKPTSGRAVVAGVDGAVATYALKRQIGYMSQLFSLYGDLTVDENIRLFSGLYNVDPERRAARRAWVLEMSGLGEQRDRPAAQLPLGWKQRLALGCAVLHEPKVLFLDEPTSGVDPISRRSFWDLIYSLAAQGTTVLVSTHYMEEAEYCHRLALMNRGRLIALDTPAGLRSRMTSPILAVDVQEGARAVEVLRSLAGIRQVGMYGRSVHAVVDDLEAVRGAIPAALAARGIAVRGMNPVSASLEDVFVALVQAEGGASLG
jgi:ABC-2 type transport system ATP-binding protein